MCAIRSFVVHQCIAGVFDVQDVSLAVVESAAMRLWPLCHLLWGTTCPCMCGGQIRCAVAARTSAVFSGHSCKLFEVVVILLDKGGGTWLRGSVASAMCFAEWSAKGVAIVRIFARPSCVLLCVWVAFP